jgi:radical SAM protein with 4Fe4S-binding SPASM domain
MMSTGGESARTGAVEWRPSTRPTLVYLKLFDNCNLRCQMCDCWKMPRDRLSARHVDAVLASILSARPYAVRFTGGEPLLYRDLDALVRQTAETGTRPIVISNGRILDRRIDGLVEAGLAELVVSIDGPQTVHDAIRGLPSLDKLCLGLGRLPGHVVLGVNTVVQRENVEHLDATLDLLLTLPVRPSWWHLIPVRGAEGTIGEREQSASAASVARIMERAKANGIDVLATPAMFIEKGAPCTVPQYVVFVDAVNGSVYGCNMLAYADASVGNVLRDPLSDILRSAPLATLQKQCSVGSHSPCHRCDPSSRLMNGYFRTRFR